MHKSPAYIEDEKVHAYMTFYSNNYLKNVMHSDTSKLWLPSRKDTKYIKEKAVQANKTPDSAFAGTKPAVLIARSPLTFLQQLHYPGFYYI
jgi:hypothetical protein